MNNDDIDGEFLNIAMNDYADRIEALVEAMRCAHRDSVEAAFANDMEAFAKSSQEAMRLFSNTPWAALPTVMMAAIAQVNRERDMSFHLFHSLVDVVESVQQWATMAPDSAEAVWIAQLMEILATAREQIDKAPYEVDSDGE